MMQVVLTCWDGRRLQLPDPARWSFRYGGDAPCDSCSVTCLWQPGGEDLLAEAVTLTAEEDGRRIFTGVVDECERGWDKTGSRLTVSGRSMAARLVDNEALGQQYQVATLEDILRDHVTPYGIQARVEVQLPSVPGFTVDTGSSEWQVLYDFCRYHGGITPRVDRQGQLVIAPWADGETRVLGPEAAITALTLRDQRYGVLSEVLVRERGGESVQRVTDEDFLARGGQCRRVVTMPDKSGYQAMRYSGRYQLEQSRTELRRLELELPEAFCAWPGELVQVQGSQPVGRGLWRVAESVCALEETGRYTRLSLCPPDTAL